MQIFTPAVLVFELFGKLNKKFDCFSGELLTLHGTKGQSEDLLITSDSNCHLTKAKVILRVKFPTPLV